MDGGENDRARGVDVIALRLIVLQLPERMGNSGETDTPESFGCCFFFTRWQDLEGQVTRQKERLEELATRTQQLVEENEQVSL